jgi:hypothetical protein
MKNNLFYTMCFLVIVDVAQAQISVPSKSVNATGTAKIMGATSIVSLAGSWLGTQTNDNGLYPQAYAFQLTDKGEFLMTSSGGVLSAQGTYSFTNNVFKASYKLFSGSETFAISGTYDAATQKLTCTIGLGTNSTGQGKFTVTRATAQVMNVNNNSAINTTVKPGVKTNAAASPAATNTTSTGPQYGTYDFNQGTDMNEYYLKKATVKVWTGNDNKEAPSSAIFNLYTNIPPPGNLRMNNDVLTTTIIAAYSSDPTKPKEYTVNSQTSLPLNIIYNYWDGVRPEYGAHMISLTDFNKNGLTLRIGYIPNFITDAWKIDRVELTVEFVKPNGALHPQLGNKTIIFATSALLNNSNDKLILMTDKFLLPLN